MKFVLELWPDIEGDPGVTAGDLLKHAIDSASSNPDLVWDILNDDGTSLYSNVSITTEEENASAPEEVEVDLDGRDFY